MCEWMFSISEAGLLLKLSVWNSISVALFPGQRWVLNPISRVRRFVQVHPTMSHFHYKAERIWATAWITPPYLDFIYFPGASQSSLFYFLFFCSPSLCTEMTVGADWFFTLQPISPPKTHSPPLFLLSGVTHAWLVKKPSPLSTNATCIWSSVLQKLYKGSYL